MTDAELLSMPAGDYMNDEQLTFFRARLAQLELDLRKTLARPVESVREVTSEADPTDVATREEEQAGELRSRDRHSRMFDEVRKAIARIEDGSYGYCEDTGEPIGIARLLARPTATLTVEAQEQRELRRKLGLVGPPVESGTER